MRPPEAFAAHDPSREGDRRVDDERRKHEHWKPRGPYPPEGAEKAERPGEETQRYRARIAHEGPRGREVVPEEARACGSQGRRRKRKRHRVGGEGRERERREPYGRHSSRQPVGAVHEVEEIRHPYQDEDR